MANNISAIAGYQQAMMQSQTGNTKKADGAADEVSSDKTGLAAAVKQAEASGVKVTKWKPLAANSVLVPTQKEGYGTVIGNVELSDKAKSYYEKLRAKYHGMDFILVSKDMKSQVAANAASYGNAHKPVVLIDDEKLERMATDESFRKKYEGLIEMSQMKLQDAKNSLASSGANVKNFGMSVGENGKASFFATIENTNALQEKILEKRQAAKKAAKAKAQKADAKREREERIEKLREKNAEKAERAQGDDEDDVFDEDREYVTFRADSLEDLIAMVSKFAYDNSASSVQTEEENSLGQNIDFKG